MSREEAIDVLEHNYPCCFKYLCEAVEMAIKALEQPEIIHCRDCKHNKFNVEKEMIYEFCGKTGYDLDELYKLIKKMRKEQYEND